MRLSSTLRRSNKTVAYLALLQATPRRVQLLPQRLQLLTALSAHSRIASICPANIHPRLRRLIRARGVNQSLFDIACERIEGLVHVYVALRADLKKRDAELVCEGLSLFCGDGALLFPVALVAYQDLVDALGGVLFDVGEPCADI